MHIYIYIYVYIYIYIYIIYIYIYFPLSLSLQHPPNLLLLHNSKLKNDQGKYYQIWK